jgi:RNA-directed DNA polymerase
LADLLDTISADLTVPRSLLEQAIAEAHYRYKKIKIPKRSGGTRTVIQPSNKLKPLLFWLDAVVFSKLPTSDIVTAFRAGTSIVNNAHRHRESKYSVRIDLSNFFQSIRSVDLLKVISKADKIPLWAKSAETLKVIATAASTKMGACQLGIQRHPTSRMQ